MRRVDKADLKANGLVGPIAEGETAEQAIERMAKLFNKPCGTYAVHMHDEPMRGDNQQYPVIIGTVWGGE